MFSEAATATVSVVLGASNEQTTQVMTVSSYALSGLRLMCWRKEFHQTLPVRKSKGTATKLAPALRIEKSAHRSFG